MNWFDKLKAIADIVKATKDGAKHFPPLMFCPIDQRRTFWIEQGRLWGCSDGHRFRVQMESGGPIPRLPGDAGDNKGEI